MPTKTRPSALAIVLTVLSDAGLGLLAWLGLALNLGVYVVGVNALLVALCCGLFLSVPHAIVRGVATLLDRREEQGGAVRPRRRVGSATSASCVAWIAVLSLAGLRHAPPDGLAVRVTGLVLAMCAMTAVALSVTGPALRRERLYRLSSALAAGGMWLWLVIALQLNSRDILAPGLVRNGWLFGLLLVVLFTALLRQRQAVAMPAVPTGVRLLGGVLPVLLVGLTLLVPHASVWSAWLAMFSMMSGLILERRLSLPARHRLAPRPTAT